MSRGRKIAIWLLVLGVLHGIVLCAGFFAPYNPVEQDRKNPYLPPMRPHFVDAQKHLHLRPFVYSLQLRPGTFDQYVENTAQLIPLKFFVSGDRYRLLGFLTARLHLFGADHERIYLLGTDAFGRDQLSRLLFGGQVSLLAGLLGAGFTLFIGWCIGAAAGYYGGWRDDLLMRIAELFLALPWLYLLFAIRAFLPLAVNPLQAFFLIVVVIAAVGWARPARLVRGIVLSAKERDFVRAAQGFNLQQYSVLVSYWWMYLPAVIMVPFFLGYLGLASALQESPGAYKIEKRSLGSLA